MIISEALASEVATHTEGTEPFYVSPEFWVAVAFIILVLALAKPIFKFGKNATFARAKKISDKLDEVRKLKEEAEALLAEYKLKFADADSEAAAIIAKAKENAEKLKKAAADDLEIALAKKEEEALSQLKSEEENASDEIRACVVDASTNAAMAIISGTLKDSISAKALISSMKELPQYLQKITV